jgi:hypothetical protein
VQALRFQRYDYMGFTYWAKDFEPPVAKGDDDIGRLSMLQSITQDFLSLVFGDDSATDWRKGPLDALASLPSLQAQVQKPF